jgi:SRSO17 transposase
MSYRLEIHEKTGYLHFQVKGENSPQTVRRYLKEIVQVCIERKCSTVLIEEHLEGAGLEITDIFQIASEGSAQANPVVGRIAYVDTNRTHSMSNVKFAETVAVNRGTYVRIFDSIRNAEEWLKDPAKNPPKDFLPAL